MMRKPVKTGARSKLWPNILKKGITFNDLLTFFFKKNVDNKQRELMICGEVIICFGEKKISFIHQFQAGF